MWELTIWLARGLPRTHIPTRAAASSGRAAANLRSAESAASGRGTRAGGDADAHGPRPVVHVHTCGWLVL